MTTIELNPAYKKIILESLEFTLKTINEELEEKLSSRIRDKRLVEKREVEQCIAYVKTDCNKDVMKINL